jgi:hypothetical protein
LGRIRARTRGTAPAEGRARFHLPPQLWYLAILIIAIGLVGTVLERLNESDRTTMQVKLEYMVYEIPRPPGAEGVSQRSTYHSGGSRASSIYQTGFGQLDIADFYARELPVQGWVQLPRSIVGTRLVFCKEGIEAEASFAALPDLDGQGQVTLSLSSGSWAMVCE